LHFQLTLGKPLETFLVLSYFNYFFDLFIANSSKSVNFANKPDLQWEFKHFNCNYILICIKHVLLLLIYM